jgi:AraC-like DNA-binding protein
MGQTRRVTSPSPNSRRQEHLSAIRAHIDRNFVSPLTVERLAAMAGLSPFHFIRTFRTMTGMTPHQYVRARRIERAQELLVTTPIPVTEVCDTVGFQSLGSFSAMFRRLTGESPGAYRAARRKSPYIPACFVRMYRADK